MGRTRTKIHEEIRKERAILEKMQEQEEGKRSPSKAVLKQSEKIDRLINEYYAAPEE